MNELICATNKYGTKSWWLNGKLHRVDGPAVERADGSKQWHLNGKLHRTDGPAVEYADGSKYWYLNGEYVTEEEFNMKTSENSKRIEVANMPEGFQVLSLETRTTNHRWVTAAELVVTIQTPDGVAKVEIPLDEDLQGTLGLNFVTQGHYY